MSAVKFLRLEDFLDNQRHGIAIHLEPQGILFAEVWLPWLHGCYGDSVLCIFFNMAPNFDLDIPPNLTVECCNLCILLVSSLFIIMFVLSDYIFKPNTVTKTQTPKTEANISKA